MYASAAAAAAAAGLIRVVQREVGCIVAARLPLFIRLYLPRRPELSFGVKRRGVKEGTRHGQQNGEREYTYKYVV